MFKIFTSTIVHLLFDGEKCCGKVKFDFMQIENQLKMLKETNSFKYADDPSI